eukprot:m51a1_g4634 putative group 1 glycosyl transferase (221) ;mRNA; f:328977-329870
MHCSRSRCAAEFWETRYREGGNSGTGSYGLNAQYKARVLNAFVRERGVASVILGVGDGNQLALGEYPRYTGVDVSPTALRRTAAKFAGDATKSFFALSTLAGVHDSECVLSADLAMSLDVVYHLVEDEALDYYMCALANSARRYLVVYAWPPAWQRPYSGIHIRDVDFHAWILKSAPWFRLVKRLPSGPGDSKAEFFFYERTSDPSAASPTMPEPEAPPA